MDEKMYTNAAEFNPDRFMVKDPPMDPRLFTFGVGRRSVFALLFFSRSCQADSVRHLSADTLH